MRTMDTPVPDLLETLDAHGHAVLPRLLDARRCAELVAMYDEDARFRSRVVMARHGFGRGEYGYFAYPLPEPVARLRAALVPHKPGSTPIRLLHCTASLRTELDLGDEWRVRASSALRDALLTIPGLQDVEFVVARANTAAPKLAEAG